MYRWNDQKLEQCSYRLAKGPDAFYEAPQTQSTAGYNTVIGGGVITEIACAQVSNEAFGWAPLIISMVLLGIIIFIQLGFLIYRKESQHKKLRE